MARPVDRLSARQARRIALAAQGFGGRRPAAGRAGLARTVGRLGLLQIDSVNVLARAHYLPPLARLGPYQRADLDALAWGPRRSRRLFEYWGHEASLIPVEQQPLFRWRMARARANQGIYGGLARFAAERGDFIDQVLAEVGRRGPLAAGELGAGGRGAGGWWGWSDGKRALEWLFWAGLVTTAGRRGFERLYDLPERVLPPAVTAAPTPATAEAQRELLRIAARALGVATEADLRDYHRLDAADARARLAELTEAGELVPVEVEGWNRPAWLWPRAARPRRVEASALLAPFDPLVWRRERAERLFGFRYRIEIYVPAHLRTHGYYVLPFLQGERLTGRLDLKADRQAGVLRVQASHPEPHVAPSEIAAALAPRLVEMAGWLGLADVAIRRDGPLDRALKAVLG